MEDKNWNKKFKGLTMSDGLMEKFKYKKMIKYKDIKNNADLIYVFYGYIYDFNFPNSLKIVKENNYLEKFLTRIESTFDNEQIIENTKELLKICNEYMDEEIKKVS